MAQMKQQYLKYAAFTLAGIVLFAASFFLFAVMSGTPLEELAMIGGMFDKGGEAEVISGDPEPDVTTELAEDRRPAEVVLSSATSPLQSFLLQSPFSTDELQKLQAELKTKITANEARQLELNERQREIETREQHLEDRWGELAGLREDLNDRELELSQRGDELTRDARVAEEREQASWEGIAKIFEEGKVKDLTDKLLSFPASNAALILRAMPESRAAELLQSITGEKFREYMEAYRKAGF
ncbi:MAG: flagellar motility protein MotE (MotC chaperone) [Planctomycetota bacterium]|jgi:flagellar motility protein MotE (MotC chaperone)